MKSNVDKILLVEDAPRDVELEGENRETLKNVAREWNSTFDAVRDSIALLDSEGKVRRCNRAMQGLLHSPYREILGLTLKELLGVSPDQLERYLLQQAQASRHKESQVIEFRLRWFRVTIDPVLDSEKTVGFVCTMHDITEHLQAEKALRESEERFRLLVEQAPEAIAVFDVDGNRFIQANAQAEKLFGCTREDLLKSGPQHFYAATQPDGFPLDDTLRENIAAVLAGKVKTIERICLVTIVIEFWVKTIRLSGPRSMSSCLPGKEDRPPLFL